MRLPRPAAPRCRTWVLARRHHSTLWSNCSASVVRVEMESGCGWGAETHNHGIQVTTSRQCGRALRRSCVHPGRSVFGPRRVPGLDAAPPPAPRARLGRGRHGPGVAARRPRIPHGPESPTPQRPMQRPSARLHPNHRGPSRPVTPVRVRPRHMTNADTFHIVHASPAVHSLTRHHTYSW